MFVVSVFILSIVNNKIVKKTKIVTLKKKHTYIRIPLGRFLNYERYKRFYFKNSLRYVPV